MGVRYRDENPLSTIVRNAKIIGGIVAIAGGLALTLTSGHIADRLWSSPIEQERGKIVQVSKGIEETLKAIIRNARQEERRIVIHHNSEENAQLLTVSFQADNLAGALTKRRITMQDRYEIEHWIGDIQTTISATNPLDEEGRKVLRTIKDQFSKVAAYIIDEGIGITNLQELERKKEDSRTALNIFGVVAIALGAFQLILSTLRPTTPDS